MKRSNYIMSVGLLFLLGAFCVIAPAVGCRDKGEPKEAKDLSTKESESQLSEQLLENAVKNLQRLDEFQGGEMRQPVIDRLNQWVRAVKLPADWQADKMLETLPKTLQDIPSVKDAAKPIFTRNDGLVLQENVWMRDVSNWARGSRLEDLARAKRLFDWTVRNIQLDEEDFGGKVDLKQWPWETLLLGRGTAVDRAWVFTLLLRQQGIDAILLALPAEDKDKANPTIWAVGVLDQNNIYLFDPKLGLPIPAAAGVKFDDGDLDVRPATLAELTKDAGPLKQLDVDGKNYADITGEKLSKLVGLVVASPASLSLRMKMFEDKLTGDDRVVLTDNPTRIAERFAAAGSLSQISLWQRPFQIMDSRGDITKEQQDAIDWVMLPFATGGNRPLWRGRTLYLKGHFTGKDNATYFLQKARPSNRHMVVLRNELLEENRPADLVDKKINAYKRGKQDATFWLGLIAAHEEDTRSAIDYFDQRILGDNPGGPWTSGAQYNLARVYESDGQLQKAVKLLKTDWGAPGRQGNLIRAKWLETELAAEKARAEAKQKAEQTTLPTLPE